MNFSYTYLSFLHSQHLHNSAPLCLNLSHRETICMISYFVQLIKTLGRLVPECLLPDDRQLPLRPALSFFFFLSLPLMFISSRRQLAFAGRNPNETAFRGDE